MNAKTHTNDNVIIDFLENSRSITDNPVRHYGHILELAIRRDRLGISEIARKLNITRRTLYNWFESEKIPIELIQKIGNVIDHDFSLEFPNEIIASQQIDHPQKGDHHSDQDNANNSVRYWMNRYIELLENYNAVLAENKTTMD